MFSPPSCSRRRQPAAVPLRLARVFWLALTPSRPPTTGPRTDMLEYAPGSNAGSVAVCVAAGGGRAVVGVCTQASSSSASNALARLGYWRWAVCVGGCFCSPALLFGHGQSGSSWCDWWRLYQTQQPLQIRRGRRTKPALAHISVAKPFRPLGNQQLPPLARAHTQTNRVAIHLGLRTSQEEGSEQLGRCHTHPVVHHLPNPSSFPARPATMSSKVKKVMTQPISVIFRMLQGKQRLQIWLYEQTNIRCVPWLVGWLVRLVA